METSSMFQLFMQVPKVAYIVDVIDDGRTVLSISSKGVLLYNAENLKLKAFRKIPDILYHCATQDHLFFTTTTGQLYQMLISSLDFKKIKTSNCEEDGTRLSVLNNRIVWAVNRQLFQYNYETKELLELFKIDDEKLCVLSNGGIGFQEDGATYLFHTNAINRNKIYLNKFHIAKRELLEVCEYPLKNINEFGQATYCLHTQQLLVPGLSKGKHAVFYFVDLSLKNAQELHVETNSDLTLTAWSPDGRFYALANEDQVWVFTFPNHQCVFLKCLKYVDDIRFTKNSNFFCIGTWDFGYMYRI